MEAMLGVCSRCAKNPKHTRLRNRRRKRLRDEIEKTRLDSRIELDAGEEARDDIPSSAVDVQPLAPDALEVARQAALAGVRSCCTPVSTDSKRNTQLMGDDFPVDDTFRITEVVQATEDAPA